MSFIALLSLFLAFTTRQQIIQASTHKDWTNSEYPDLRGPSYKECASKVPENKLLYICDPDGVLNSSELLRINAKLEALAQKTPCPCQRRSQCSSDSGKVHGFIVSIALVDQLQMVVHSPSELQLTDRAESFCKTLEGRWALGDCGNSVIVFVWKHYKKVMIWPARLAANYITQEERKRILSGVNDLIQTDKWCDAISDIIAEMYSELMGEPEHRVDTGTLSLIIAVGVASLLTILVTCCVCAFRCCSTQSDELFVEDLGASGAGGGAVKSKPPPAPSRKYFEPPSIQTNYDGSSYQHFHQHHSPPMMANNNSMNSSFHQHHQHQPATTFIHRPQIINASPRPHSQNLQQQQQSPPQVTLPERLNLNIVAMTDTTLV